MAECKCGCGVYTLDPENATLVLNGIPQCNEVCLRRAERRDPRASRDVPPGECWLFREHRTLAQVDIDLARRVLAARIIHAMPLIGSAAVLSIAALA